MTIKFVLSEYPIGLVFLTKCVICRRNTKLTTFLQNDTLKID